ncbi:MAG: TetR/AcrR family transcriptional regulator [Actinobacteria bacterium]|nr:MAG: TetR/AcrR family transcriptional regulator [Actinomycetota bacterium]
MESLSRTLARRSLARSIAEREESYEEEIQAILEATYRVIQRTGSFDPTLRAILRESRLSTEAFYKHFRSKDELLLLLLDDGRRKLVSYLAHRMDKTKIPVAKVRAWIEGVLAQAADPKAAARTRPFLANRDRLAEQFPAEHQASVDLLVDLLADAIADLPGRAKKDGANARRDAVAIYDVTFGALHRYLTSGAKPAPADIEHLVRFSVNAAGGKA